MLTYERARAVLDACLARAEALGLGVSVAVVDEGGNPVAVARMTRARRGTTSHACQGKALVAAVWGAPSGEIAERLSHLADVREHAQALYGHRLVFLGGGLPLVEGGRVVGAVAASGGTSAQDLEIATAGAAEFTVAPAGA